MIPAALLTRSDGGKVVAPTVVVQLVTWNGEQWLPRLLKSLECQTYLHLEYYVLDNGSQDRTVEIVKSWLNRHPGELILQPKNTGFAAAHNTLLRVQHAPFILILNQDTILTPAYVTALVQAMADHPEAGSSTGRLRRMSSIQDEVELDSEGLTIYKTHRVVETHAGQTFVPEDKQPRATFGVPATAALYRRSALEATALSYRQPVEYFDELFFSYKEDVDLAYRLQLAGFSSLVVPLAEAHHYRTLKPESRTRHALGTLQTVLHYAQKTKTQQKLSYRNHLYFLLGTVSAPLCSWRWWATVSYECGKLAVILIKHPAVLSVWADVSSSWSRLREKRSWIQHLVHHPERVVEWMVW